MKKLMLSLTLVAGLGLAAVAQTGPVRFGLKAGVNFANMKVSANQLEGEDAEGFKTKPSVYVGGTVEFPVSNVFSLQSGLSYIGKGVKFEESVTMDGDSYSAVAKINFGYLELPVNAIFKFDAGQGSLFFGAGAYYGYALTGKTKVEVSATVDGQTEKETESEDLIFGNTEADDFRRGDYGLNFLAGYQLANGLSLQGGYGLGLRNISPSSEGKVKHKGFSVGLGFSF